MASSSQPTYLETGYFPCPTGVKVADHVTRELCPTNYSDWKRLMATFLTNQKLIGFVNGDISPVNEPPPLQRLESRLEKCSMEEELKAESDRRASWERQRDSKQMRDASLNCLIEWKGEIEKSVGNWEKKRMEEWKSEQERREAEWNREREQLQESMKKLREKANQGLASTMEMDQKSREKGKQVLDESQQKNRQELYQEGKKVLEKEQQWGSRGRSWEESQEDELKAEQRRREGWKQRWDESWKISVEKELWKELGLETEKRNEWHREQERRKKQRWERLFEWVLRQRQHLLDQEDDREYTDWKRSDGLVMGWILAVMEKGILVQVKHSKTAREVWIKLQKIFIPPFGVGSSAERIDWTDQERRMKLSKYVELHQAALSGDWNKTKTLLQSEPDAVFEHITWFSETALIVAIRSDYQNDFVMNLLTRMVLEITKLEDMEFIERMIEGLEGMAREPMEGIKEDCMKEMEMRLQKWIERRMEEVERMDLKRKESKYWETIMKWDHEMIKSMRTMMTIMMRVSMDEEMTMICMEKKRMMETIVKHETTVTEVMEMMRNRGMAEQEMRQKQWREMTRIMKQETTILEEITEQEKTMMETMEQERRGTGRQSLMWKLAGKDISGATALHAAVEGGNIVAAKWLVHLHSQLANTGDKYGKLAVHEAAKRGNREMVNFLLPSTTNLSENESDQKLLYSLTASGLYDIALTFLQRYPRLASMKPSPLVLISQNCTSFLSGTNLNFFQRLLYFVIENCSQGGGSQEDAANHHKEGDIESPGTDHPQERDTENPAKCMFRCCECVVSALISVWQKLNAVLFSVLAKILALQIKYIKDIKLTNHQAVELVKFLCTKTVEIDFLNSAELFTEPLMNATCTGIHEILAEILYSFPDAIRIRSETNDQSLFHLAIVYRRESIFNVIYQMKVDKRCTYLSDTDALRNNGLHLAGKLTVEQQLSLRASVAGAAQQMQREVQWFKEVEKFVLPEAKKLRNIEGKTPQEVFTDTHKNLATEGEKWMKDNAGSCSIVAALITTIVFAAAISIPGSYGTQGLPFFLGNRAFTWFTVSNAIAMLSSSASLLAFLSVLTCRYAEEDFLYALPRRMIIGQVTLFFAIISIMVAFAATLTVVSGEKKKKIIISVGVSCCVPITIFAFFQFKLFLAMIKSTYFPGIFKKQSSCRRVST